MEPGNVTTPFGQRSMTLGMLASQKAASQLQADQSVDKWKIYRSLCTAKPLLGVTDRALAVLNALLSFHPQNVLSEESGLVVFPSNAQLSLRSHGMAEQTIRRHLAVLVETGLIIRKDSPNGKRYARRASGGEIGEAFGFSLAPLIVRAEEIEHLAAEVAAERLHLQRLREQFTLCRRDVSKLIETAMEEDLAGDWETAFGYFRELVEALPRTPTAKQVALALEEMQTLRDDITNRLETLIKAEKSSGNPAQNGRHIQNSNPDSISDLEPALETKQGANSAFRNEPYTAASQQKHKRDDQTPGGARSNTTDSSPSLKSFPLGLVLQACPDMVNYGPGGSIATWRDMMAAAVVVRGMLGVSPAAYEEAAIIMGAENAATVMACILERGGHINSAGGYLRDLTRRAEKGEFSVGPMLMSLVRARGGVTRRAG
ncbi:replication initiation protein RepC [Rhizobium sp. R72]|uniref:plasmid replication protein RepC n=1 Tax=unclassified Rhizobium TaxID=2613769 RepID=UPI000B52D36D|nr:MULTISPECIES: plasmid replication protein RepC [unclassified Rhizobium]OWW04087.1 replication initiation protein RepC [Rhizobium sp. R72]OWW04290.1 replication initiation protein RepC [Rhizobium sp. R711]